MQEIGKAAEQLLARMTGTPIQWGRSQALFALAVGAAAGRGTAPWHTLHEAVQQVLDTCHDLWRYAAGYVVALAGFTASAANPAPAALEKLYSQLLEQARQGDLGQRNIAEPEDVAFAVFPFFTWYEMYHNNKENSGLLFAQLGALQERQAPQTSVAFSPQAYLTQAVQALALTLVWRSADEEAYEQFAQAQQWVRGAVGELVRQRFASGAPPAPTVETDTADLLLAYCIRCGVDGYALIDERYLPYIQPLTRALQRPVPGAFEDMAFMGAAILYLQENNQPPWERSLTNE